MNKLTLEGFEVWESGGGCTALRQDFANGHYVLITANDDVTVPDEDGPFVIGEYDADGQGVHGETVSDLRESFILNQYGVVNNANP